MKKTKVLLDKLLILAQGKTLPISSLKGEWFEQMQQDHILIAVTHGSRRSLRVANEQIFRNYLDSQYDIRDLEKTYELLLMSEADRGTQVNLTGDSKFVQQRSCPGFMVNSYSPIPARLNGKDIIIAPEEGSMLFIADWQNFVIAEDVLVVGVENMENFRLIRKQKYLFPEDKRVLFVSRYPQSKDLRQWLINIPNSYLHFGDFDIAGLRIYETEFYNHIGSRASFLIPEDIEARLKSGSTERYNDQYQKFKNYKPLDKRILPLFEMINRYHKGYDQEGYIIENTII